MKTRYWMYIFLFTLLVVVPFVLFILWLAESHIHVSYAAIYLWPVMGLFVAGLFGWFYRQEKKRRKSSAADQLTTTA